MNVGKRFEQNFRKSIPENIFYYRLKDNNNTWSGANKVRFTTNNICDSIMFDGDYLYLLELKSTKGKSLPLSNIKKNQIDGLTWGNQYANVISGFVIEFSEIEECYFIEISQFNEFLEKNDKNPIPIDFCRKNGIKIDVEKKKINSKFNISKFIEKVIQKVV